MVAGDDEHGRIEHSDARDGVVELFDASDFGVEVAVFAGAVGVFEVEEEEVVFGPVAFEDVDLLVERLGCTDNVHADEAGKAFVHRIDGDGGGLQSVDFFVGGKLGFFGEAAKGEAVGFFLVGQDFRAWAMNSAWRLRRFFRCRVWRRDRGAQHR